MRNSEKIQIDGGRHMSVQTVLLVNFSEVVFEGCLFIDRVLSGDKPQSIPTYKALSGTKTYALLSDFVSKWAHRIENHQHILLPLRKKQCH